MSLLKQTNLSGRTAEEVPTWGRREKNSASPFIPRSKALWVSERETEANIYSMKEGHSSSNSSKIGSMISSPHVGGICDGFTHSSQGYSRR